MAETMYNPDNSGLLAELINANGRNNSDQCGMWNNPFMYLIWLALFGGGNGFGFGNRGYDAQGIQNNEFMSRLNHIEGQMQDNHANTLAMDAIKGNQQALNELATNLHVSTAQLENAIHNIHRDMDRIADQIGLSREGIMGAIALGNKDLMHQMCECCSKTNENITKMGYEAQIRDMQNTAELKESINRVNTGMERGFSTIAYESLKQTCEIINSNKDNTQRILDTLNTHWSQLTSQALQDAKFEISQLKQNQYLVDKLTT